MKYYLTNNNNIILVWHLAINEHNPNSDKIISGQINDLKHSGILDHSILYISLMCENNIVVNNYYHSLKRDFINNNVVIITHSKNLYEYQAIKLMHVLSYFYSKSIFLYFHTKGMFFNNFPQDLNSDKRHTYENALTKYTIYPYKTILNIFNNNSHINKIGLFPTPDPYSFIWFNFFWIRASYLQFCNEPEKPSHINNPNIRYTYETWIRNEYIGKYKINKINEYGDTYSLISKSNKICEFPLIDDIGIYLKEFPIEYDEEYLNNIKLKHNPNEIK
jgi:hypothetical protein